MTNATAGPRADPTRAQAPQSDRDIVPVHDWIYRLMYGLYSIYFRFGHWEIHGRDNVPLHGPIIIASNHVSLLDPPLIGSSMPRVVTTMAKHELFEKKILGLKILGFIIQHMGAFPVKRGVPDRAALRRATQVLKDGGALVIFPEGTRTRDGNLGQAELGMAMIAHSTKTPIVPVYLKGTHRCFSRLHPGLSMVKAEVFYGRPLHFDEEFARRGNRETLQAMTDKVMGEIAHMRDEAPVAS